MVGRMTEGCSKFIEEIQTCRSAHVSVKVKVRPLTDHEGPEVA